MPSKGRLMSTPSEVDGDLPNPNGKGDDKPKSIFKRKKGPEKRKSKCSSILSCIFCTRNLSEKQDREENVRNSLIGCMIYLVYLTVVCTIVFGSNNNSAPFYYTNSISKLFLDVPLRPGDLTTFRTSTTVEDFWSFAENVMPKSLYWKYWYGIDDPGNSIPIRDRGVLYENRLIGKPRLRQIRVNDVRCPISEKFIRLFRKCYPSYSKKYENKGSYAPAISPSLGLRPEWKYFSEKDLYGHTHWGQLATYSGGGAIKLLGTEKAETIQFVNELKTNLWITRATRVVFLEFTMHNANVNLFCVVTLVWEFPPTGGVVTSWKIQPLKLGRYLTVWQYFIIAMEIAFMVFTVFFTFQEIVEMILTKCCFYWTSLWSYIDILMLLLSYTVIALGFFRYYMVYYTLAIRIDNPSGFAFLHGLQVWEEAYNDVWAGLAFLVWIKAFKYISFNKTMTQLSLTMSRCAKDIAGFAVMFFIVFIAFAQLAFLIFGSTISDFRSFTQTTYALLRLILGDFDFRAMEAANRVLGPIFFVTYVFFVFFLLLNMFLAIINDTYSEVKADSKLHKNQYQTSDYIKSFFTGGCCKKKNRAKLEVANNVVTSGEIRKHLENSGFTELEVEMFMTRYELDVNRPLDLDEAEYVLGALEGYHSDGRGMEVYNRREVKYENNLNENNLADEEISELQARVGAMESVLTNVTRKIDILISKMNSSEPIVRNARSYN